MSMLLISSHISLFTDSLKTHLLSKYFSLQWPCVIICHYFIFYIWQHDQCFWSVFFFYWQHESISISPRLSAPFISVFFISVFSFLLLPSMLFLENEVATRCSIRAWEISRTEQPAGFQSLGSQKSLTWLSD